jgi:hypothetical protein
VDDGLNEWRRQELLWSVRWLAADPKAALAAVPGVVTADEIALDLEHWTESLWTDDAIAFSPHWREQRRRARELLRELGQERADQQLGAARPGGPVYDFQKSRRPR